MAERITIRRKIYILLFGLFCLTFLSAEWPVSACDNSQAQIADVAAYKIAGEHQQLAIVWQNMQVPTAQTCRTNQHSSPTPTFNAREFARQKVQIELKFQLFLKNFRYTTDAVAAHYFVIALRRILR